MIAAILRAQLLSMRGMGFGRTVGFYIGLIPVLLYYGFWAMIAWALHAVLSDAATTDLIRPITIGMLAVFLYWQISPIITNTMGASLDLKKLLVYPISLNKLFVTEVLLRFFTVTEMLLVLALAALGLLRNPGVGWSAAPRIAASTLLFILFNLLVAAGMRSVIERLFRGKRAREVGMLFFVMVAVAPSAVIGLHLPLEKLLPFLPVSLAFPWSAVASLWLGASWAVSSAVMLAWLPAAYVFGRWQFARGLLTDNSPTAIAIKRESSRTVGAIDALFRIPSRLLPDPLGGLAEKDLRTLSRCAGFRLTFVMGFTFGLLVFLPSAMRGGSSNFLQRHFLAGVSLYSMMLLGYYTFWNAFGFDRSAAQFYFAAPVSFRTVLLAKNVAAAAAQSVELLLVVAASSFLPFPAHGVAILEAVGATAVTCLYLFAAGNLASVRYPVAMDPDKMGQSKRSTSALTMLLVPFGFLPIGLAYWAWNVFDSIWVFFGLLAVAALIGGVFYWVATDSAVELAFKRREPMIEALSRGSGPLSIR